MANTDPQQTVDVTVSEFQPNHPETATEPPLQYDDRLYELIEELGKGGMGEVYRAGDPALGRDLAIKVMLADYCGDSQAERRFLREARITGSLQHPGIVAVYNLGRLADGRLHYTMRLVRGRTFADILKDEPGKPERLPSLLTIFEKICQAVAYAHSKQVIHRDLKPANVMVGKFGEVQVMDWGLAKLLTPQGEQVEGEQRMEAEGTRIHTEAANTASDLTRSGSGMGTPAYMSPEQALGELETVDERTDVFALGSILCKMLTGQPAYRGRDSEEVLRRARRGDLAEAVARLEKSEADEELRTLCRECLAADFAQRPRNAGVVAQRIADYQVTVQERLRRAELERVAAETRARAEQARAAVEAERAKEAQARAKAERRAKQRTLALALAVVAIFCLGSGGGWWIAHERAARAEDMISHLEADARANEARNHYMQGEVFYNKDRRNEAITEYHKALELQPDNVEYWSVLADVLYEEEKWDEAITAYEAVIRLKPDYAIAHHGLGVGLHKTGQADRAIMAFREAIRLDPEYAAVHDDLGDLFLDTKQWDQSIASYREAVRLEPNNAVYHNDLGNSLRNKGRLDEAIAAYREAIRLKPQEALYPDNLGDCLQKKGQLEEAIAAYREAIRLDPNNAVYHDDLGNSLQNKGRLDEAIAEYREAIRLKPQEALYPDNLGDCLRKKGQLDEAIAQYREALRLKPDYAIAHNDLGLALDDKGKLGEAISAFREAIRLDPRKEIYHNNLGNVLRKMGHLDEAMAEYKEAIRLKPDYANAHNGYGNVLDDKGRRDEAIVEYRQAIRLSPRDAIYHNNLGLVLRKKGHLDEAMAEYKEAIRLKPDYANAHNGYGNVLDDKGRLDEAIIEFRQAIRLSPRDAIYHNNLGLVLRKKGHLDEAMAEHKEAIRLKPDYAPAHNGLGLALMWQGDYLKAKASWQAAIQLTPHGNPEYQSQLQKCEKYLSLQRELLVVLQGKEFSANPVETIALAEMCGHKMRYDIATRLFAEAFTADPKLAAGSEYGHRYNAAYCAVLAAAGQGEGRGVPDKVASMFRRWALDWLRSLLNSFIQLVEQNEPAARQTVRKKLVHWRTDLDLVSVRESAGLNRLPETERLAWQALWRDVDQLAERVTKQEIAAERQKHEPEAKKSAVKK